MVHEYYKSAHEANGAFSLTIDTLTPAPSHMYNLTVARETMQACRNSISVSACCCEKQIQLKKSKGFDSWLVCVCIR